MIHEFTTETLAAVGDILNSEPKTTGKVVRFKVVNDENKTQIALEIHLGLDVEGMKTNMVSVYSNNVFLQLHNCTGFVASETLQQVTFFGKIGGQTSGLIIEKQGGISMYSNVNDALLQTDFTQLPPEVMMCSVAMSLTESLDFEGFNFDED